MFISHKNKLYNDNIEPNNFNDMHKESLDIFKKTNVYKYYKNNKDNIILRKIIRKNKPFNHIDVVYILSDIYSDIVSNENMQNIVTELIKINDESENKYIYKSAVFSANFKVLDELISNGFNVNTLFTNLNYFDTKDEPILVEAIDKVNIDVIKYLINNGANPYLCCNTAIIFGLSNENLDIFNFFKQYEIPVKDFEEAFIQFLSRIRIFGNFTRSRRNTQNNNNRSNNIESNINERINFFLDQGCDINKIYQNEIEIFARLNIDILKYLENKQLQIDHQLINKAIFLNNVSMTEYLLQQGFIPDNNILLDVVSKFKIEFLKLLIKYQIDISTIEPIKNENHQLLNNLIQTGISCEKLLDCIITGYCYYD
ncbi:repeat protein [Moumouvirus goulette]|uniref:Repeat protein n=1 Tax=Moumouvirus goulette TaxID=1247379 RepID=M1PHN4_9VIRU|nr:repeat protein [Moumouvirus goulette]AGF85598.1 repeat protein [Moumouvirus goulette]